MPLLFLLAAAQVALVSPPALRPGLAALPRIARPANVAQRRVNAALARADAATRRGARACLDPDELSNGNPTSWERRVVATMRGPDFLSIAIEDDVDCGGAHPSNSHSALVYDLATGALVDWPRLLTRGLAGETGVHEGPGLASATLSSPALGRLYIQGYPASLDDPQSRESCKGTAELAMEGGQPLLAWLDARVGALVLQFDWNHAMQICSRPVTVSAEMLRREGASARLVAALLAGRRRGSYSGSSPRP